MKRIALLLLFLLGARALRAQVGTVTGSLTVAISSRDGLVVCADKRGAYEDGDKVAYNDTLTKLWKLNDQTAFAVTGKMALYVTGTTKDAPRTILWDISKITGEFFKNKPSPYTSKDWDLYGESIILETNKVMKTTGVDWLSKEPAAIHFFSVNAQGELNYSIVQVATSPSTSRVKVVHFEQPQAVFQEPIVQGATSVFDELIKGHDPRFDDIRHDAEFMSVIKGGNASMDLQTMKSRRAAQHLIRLTNERLTMLSGKYPFSTVSATSDCGLLNKSSRSWNKLD